MLCFRVYVSVSKTLTNLRISNKSEALHIQMICINITKADKYTKHKKKCHGL